MKSMSELANWIHELARARMKEKRILMKNELMNER